LNAILVNCSEDEEKKTLWSEQTGLEYPNWNQERTFEEEVEEVHTAGFERSSFSLQLLGEVALEPGIPVASCFVDHSLGTANLVGFFRVFDLDLIFDLVQLIFGCKRIGFGFRRIGFSFSFKRFGLIFGWRFGKGGKLEYTDRKLPMS
jgi:hypothetical protein